MQTPQKATAETEAPDTLVMRGVGGEARSIPGALKFQSRCRVIAEGGKINTERESISVSGANSATLLIAIATSYRSYKDTSGNPEALTKNYLNAATKKPFAALRRDHITEHQRLFRRVHLDLDLTETGARTARVQYGARGWVTHHNTDLWRATAPVDGPQWGMWPTGGAWLCQHLWEHYLYTGDQRFLKRVYPALKGASLFF